MKFSGFNTTEKVGIGTTSPAETLTLDSSSNTRLLMREGGSNKGQIAAGGGGLYIQNLAGDVIFRNISDADTVRIKNDGKVGIGTTAPEVPLVVAGAAGNQAIFRSNESSASQRAGGGFSSSGNATAASRYARMFLDADGSDFSGTDYFAIEKFGNSGEVKFLQYSNATMSFWVNTTTQAMTIKNDGNVGIGTTSPSSKFHVNGRTQLNGDLDFVTMGNYITFYGDSSQQHSISSRNSSGAAADDIRINTYGALFINLDSNGNDTSEAHTSFKIGRHAGVGAVSASDLLLNLSGETGKLRLYKYGSGTHTGTATYKLSVDSSGNVIETAIGAGAVDGSGTANYVTKWTDSDTIGNSVIAESSSKIGIGTATPANAVLVANHAGTSTPTNNIELMGSSLVTNGGTAIFFKASSNTTLNRYGARIHSIRTTANNGATDLVFSNENAGATALDETMRITADGNVGIGTNAPGANLDSDTDTNWSSGWANNLRLTSVYYPCLRFFAQASNKTSLIGNNHDGGLWFGVNGSGDAYSGYAMVIKPDGKVGIGATNPGATLANGFVGTAGVLEIRPNASGADAGLFLRRFDGDAVYGLDLWTDTNAATSYIDQRGNLDAANLYIRTRTHGTPKNNIIAYGTGNVTFEAGNVGIGTNAPTARLNVKASGSTVDQIAVTHSGNTVEIAQLGQSANGNSAGALLLKNNGGTDKVYLDAAGSSYLNGGSVGIGCTNPQNKFTVQVGTDHRIGFWGTSTYSAIQSVNDANTVLKPFRFDASSYSFYGGNATVSRTSNDATFLVTRTDQSNISLIAAGSGYVRASAKLVLQAAGGSHNITMLTDGKVGIGTTAPSAKLHIKQGGDFTGSGGALLHIGTSVITNTSDLGLMVSVDDAHTTSPQKAGLILYNNNATAGGWSPMLLFSKKESGASPYQATMAGIAAKAPLGTGNGGAWIDGELHFYTAGAATSGIVPRMVINSSGNVGIGTTAPASLLQVGGAAASIHAAADDFTIAPAVTDVGMTIRCNTTAGTGSIFFADSAATAQGQIRYNHNFDYMSFYSSGDFFFDTGSVGIGTTAPGAKLDVRGSSGYLKFDTSGADGTIKSDYNLKLYADDTGDNSSGYQNIQFYTAGANERMRITSDGKVGIGTTAPAYALDVRSSGATTLQVKSANNADDTQLTLKSNAFYFNITNQGAGGNITYESDDGQDQIWYTDNASNAPVERFRIEGGANTDSTYFSNCNVGIGTTAPAALLHLKGGTATSEKSHILFENTSGAKKFAIGGGGSGLTNNGLGFRNVTDNTLPMIIDDSGDVGIGTTAPAASLHVNKTYVNNRASLILTNSSNTPFTGAYYDSVVINQDDVPCLRIRETGNSGNVELTFAVGNENSSSAVIGTTGMLRFATNRSVNQLGYSDQNTRMVILANGKVIINDTATTNNNNAQLYVNGPVYGSEFDLPTGGQLDWANGDARIVEGLVSNYSLSLQNYDGSSAMVTTMFLKSGGNVGIGTTNPTEMLHIKKPSGTGSFIRFEDSGGGGVYIGARSNVMELYAGGAERMRIASDGKVGIGTNAPTEKLDVEGSLVLNVATGSGLGEEGIFFRRGFSNSNKYNVSIFAFAHDGAGNFSDGISINGYDGVSFCTGSNTRQERMRIVGGSGSTSGYVGIGTTAPASKLHIKDAVNPPAIRFEDANGGTQTAKIVYDQSGQNSLVLSTQYQSSTDLNLIQFAPADNVAMTIRGGTGTSDGFVGIGTTAPSNLLSVEGSINGDYLAEFKQGHSTAGQSYGVNITAGTNASDQAFRVANQAQSTLMEVRGDGEIRIAGQTLVDSANTNYKMTFPDNSGIAMGSAYTYANIYGSGGNLYLKANAYAANLGNNPSKIYLVTAGNAGSTAPDVVIKGGSVGIGTDAPLCKLDIRTTSASLIDAGATVNIEEDTAWTQGLALYINNADVYNGDYASACIGVANSGSNIIITAGAKVVNNPGASNGYKTLNSTAPSVYRQVNGAHLFYGDTGKTANTLYTPTERMRIDDDGKVGIGTTAPDSLLQIANANGSSYRFGYAGTSDIYFDADDVYFRSDNGGVNNMVLKGSKLGIGTTAPANLLHLYRSGNDSIPELMVHSVTTSTTVDYYKYAIVGKADGAHASWSRGFGVVGLADAAQFHRAVGVYASLDLNLPSGVSYDSALFADGKDIGYAGTFMGGNVGIGTTAPATKLHVYHNTTNEYAAIIDQDEPNAGHGLKVTSDGNGAGSNILEVESGSTSLFRVRGDGRVGIGITTPTTTLDVYHATHSQLTVSSPGNQDSSLSLIERTSVSAFGSANVYGFQWKYDGGDNKLFLSSGVDTNVVNRLTVQRDDGNVGIGTTAPAAPFHVHKDSSTAVRLVRGATDGQVIQFYRGSSISGNIQVRSSGLAIGGGSSEDDIFIDTAGKVGINDITPSYQLDVNGTFRSTGAAYFNGAAYTTGQAYNGGLRIGGAGGSSYAFAGERLFTIPAFPNGVANQKVDLYWTGQFWGYMEIEITGSYTNQNMAGVLTKSFALGLNANNSIIQNESWYSNLGGLTYGSFAISDVTWDSTNSRYRIQIVHRTSTGNTVRLKLRCLGDSASQTDTFMTGTTVSAIYTTDTTAFATPVKELAAPNDNAWFNGGYLGIGTSTPSELLDIETGGGGGHVELNNPDSGGNSYVIGVTDTGAPGYGVAGSLFIRDGGNSRFVLTSSGCVGIGTNDPSNLLHVNGLARFNQATVSGSGVNLPFLVTTSNGTDMGQFSSSLTTYARLRIDCAAGGDAQIAFMSAQSSKWSIGNDAGDSHKFKIATGFGAFSGAETLMIQQDGNIGIGTNIAGTKLHVNGTITGTSKNFIIDHPTKEGMKLVHSSLEGPEVGVYYRGRAQSKTITLPDYWSGLVRDGTITVQLTPNGSFQHLYVMSTSLTEIKIGAAEGETIDCYYTIYGERADLDPLVVEKIV